MGPTAANRAEGGESKGNFPLGVEPPRRSPPAGGSHIEGIGFFFRIGPGTREVAAEMTDLAAT